MSLTEIKIVLAITFISILWIPVGSYFDFTLLHNRKMKHLVEFDVSNKWAFLRLNCMETALFITGLWLGVLLTSA